MSINGALAVGGSVAGDDRSKEERLACHRVSSWGMAQLQHECSKS